MNKSVTIITSEFPPGPGGIGNHSYNLAQWLSTSDYRVKVVTDSRQAFFKNESNFDKEISFKVERSERHRGALVGIVSRSLLYFRAINTSSEHRVYLASGKFPIWFCGISSIFFPKKEFIAIVHGTEVNSQKWFNRFYTKWCLRKMGFVIAVSSYTKSLVQRLDSEIKVKVIPNGIDKNKFQNTNIYKKSDCGLSLITVGSVTNRKGQINVIKSLPLILKKNPKMMYHIVGLPIGKEKILKTAKSLKVENNITLHGSLNDKKMIQILKSSDIFLMLSQESNSGDVEGFGIAILEANYLGIPALGSKNTGIEDAICDGFSGFLVDPHNPKQIGSCIEVILENYEKYSKNAEKWARNFYWSKVIKSYIKVLS
jgi:phosphatidyl-myo-inositol dimannoside synthase